MTALLVAVAIWPLAQRALVAAYDVNPWKLGGFAMYATQTFTLAALLDASGTAFAPIDEGSLPAEARERLAAFRAEREALGRLRRPDDVGRAVLAARPDVENLVVVVQLLELDPDTAHIVSRKETFLYERSQLDPASSTSSTLR